MNNARFLTIATLALTAACAAQAGDADPVALRAQTVESARSRADVRSEAIAALRDRRANRFSDELGYAPSGVTMSTSTLTRAEVARPSRGALHSNDLTQESGLNCVC